MKTIIIGFVTFFSANLLLAEPTPIKKSDFVNFIIELARRHQQDFCQAGIGSFVKTIRSNEGNKCLDKLVGSIALLACHDYAGFEKSHCYKNAINEKGIADVVEAKTYLISQPQLSPQCALIEDILPNEKTNCQAIINAYQNHQQKVYLAGQKQIAEAEAKRKNEEAQKSKELAVKRAQTIAERKEIIINVIKEESLSPKGTIETDQDFVSSVFRSAHAKIFPYLDYDRNRIETVFSLTGIPTGHYSLINLKREFNKEAQKE